MSRGKLRGVADTCADCGALGPNWASINRGLLICDECCCIHRSLGRHVSQIKSLKKGTWNPAQLAMVHALHNSGANSVWEHSLLDPSVTKGAKKKPNAKDPVHSIKADFIRAKHQNLSFVYRPSKEDGPLLEEDVNKQLHSSVRTGNLETSLRFLSVGADPNYLHPEKGCMPLHVAAKCGQASQVELLFVYGADPATPDKDGKTPVDYAREASHSHLAERLIECQYELTDRMTFYLCGRKPDHKSGHHFLIPEMADSLDQSELIISAKKKLEALPNNLLGELAMDIYDEVDRRETDAFWLSTQNQSALVADRQSVPFLPVNPDFSSTRNQGRQKLARFNAREFAALIIDVLVEVKRRHQGPTSNAGTNSKDKAPKNSSLYPNVKTRKMQSSTAASDDEPLYDSVASDEDYVDSQKILPHEAKVKVSVTPIKQPATHITLREFNELRYKLTASEMKVHQLQQKNKDIKQENALLQNMVQRLMQENTYLRSFVQYKTVDHNSTKNLLPNGYESMTPNLLPVPGDNSTLPELAPSKCSPRSSQQRPQSMYEPRERLTHPALALSSNHQNINYGQPVILPRDDSGIGHTQSSHSSRDSGDYDNTSLNASRTSSCLQSRSNSMSPPTEIASPATEIQPFSCTKQDCNPSQEEVFRKTEQITKKIQELLISAQEGKHQSFIPCSEKVYRAVLEMASIFPQNQKDLTIHSGLKQLTDSAFRLQSECQILLCQHQQAIDYRFITQQVIQCAYDIAKAAKQLVTLFQ